MTAAKVKKFHHVSLAVEDAASVMKTWTKVLGIGPWTEIDLGGEDAKGHPWKAKEYWAHVGDVVIEIIQPIEGRIVQSRFLETKGPGLHHVAFEVDDVEQTLTEMVEDGAELIVKHPGSFAYLRTGGADGVVVEISQHAPDSGADRPLASL